MKKLIAFIVTSLLLPLAASAVVKPSPLFASRMVLQRGVEIPVWGTAQANETVTVRLNGRVATTRANASGYWLVKLPSQKAGGPFQLEIEGDNLITCDDVMVGDVWLCSGQSNMDMTVAKEDRYWCGVNNEADEVANANYPLIRVFDVEYTPNHYPQQNPAGMWEICSPQTVGHFSAVSYFFARDIFRQYHIPIGLITSAYGASTAETWISKEALEAHPNLKSLLDAYTAKWDKFVADSAATLTKYRDEMARFKGNLAAVQAAAGDVSAKKPKAPRNPDPSLDQHNPFVCFNGMIAPLVPFALKGALWYQGESNGPSATLYREIMETLIADWRAKFANDKLPFLYVQLANYGKSMQEPVEDGPMMTVREAQLLNLSVPHTGMAVAIDNAADQPTNIHPKNKQAIGHRLALIAQAQVYGDRVEYAGPMYKSYTIKDNTIQLSFDHTGKGLVAKDGKLTGFAICGEDRNWVTADAVIKGKKIIVSSPQVAQPVAVRYCWGTNPPASLTNREGLWAPNFRTDNW